MGQSEYSDTGNIEGNQNTETQITLRAIRIQRHRQHCGQSEYRDTGNIGQSEYRDTGNIEAIRIQRHRQHWTQSEYRDTGNIEGNVACASVF